LNWFTKYSNFAKTCEAQYDNYSNVTSGLRRLIQIEIRNEYEGCRNENGPKVVIQRIVEFCNKYNNHTENRFKKDIINPNRVNGTAGEKEIIAGFTSQFWEDDNVAQFIKYKEVNKLLSSVSNYNNTEWQYDNDELLSKLLSSNDLFVSDLGDTQDLPKTINDKYKKYFDEMKELILELTKGNENCNTQERNKLAALLYDKVADFIKEVNGFINTNNDSDALNITINSNYTIHNCAQKFINFILTHDYESCNEIFGQINALQFVRIMKMIESSDNDELSIQQYRSYLLQSAILNICDNIDNYNVLLEELYNNVGNIKLLSNSINKIKILNINNSNEIRLLNYLGEKRTIPDNLRKIQNAYEQYYGERFQTNLNDIVNILKKANNNINNNHVENNNINNNNINNNNNLDAEIDQLKPKSSAAADELGNEHEEDSEYSKD